MRCLVIALVAVIGFSFAACGDGNSNGNGGSGLTITGLPNGQWNVLVFAAGTDISNYDAFDIISSIGSNKIDAANYGGSSGNFFPLVKVKVGGPTGPEDIWTGSGSRPVALNNGSTAIYSWATVNFSNGKGTVPFSSFKPLGSGGEDPGTGDNPGTGGSGTEANPIALTAGTWANGSVPLASSVVWYSFNVTSGTTYYVWWNDYYGGDDTKTADVEVSAYYSNGTRIFEEEDSGWSYPESFTASSSGTVKIKVEPYHYHYVSSPEKTGTFAIVYSTSSTRPGAGGGGDNPGTGGSGTEANPIPLTAGTWADGSVPSGSSVVWYSFSVTGGTTYYVWWNDGYGSDGTKTLDVKVSAYYSSGTSLFTGIDSGWSSYQSFSASSSGTIKIKVEPYSSGNTGTFAVVYSTSSTRPGSSGSNPGHTHTFSDAWSYDEKWHWHACTANDGARTMIEDHTSSICSICDYKGYIGKTITPLTAGVWKDDTLAQNVDAEWYSFNATAEQTYYIWWNNGENYNSGDGTKTPDRLFVSAFNDDGTEIFIGEWGRWYTPQQFTVTSGGTIRIEVSRGYRDGVREETFAVGYNTSDARPPLSGAQAGPTHWIAATTMQYNISAIRFGGGRFIAVGSPGILYSDDGIQWTAVENTTFRSGDGIYDVAYGSDGSGGNRWVAVGSSGRMAYSSDGTEWTAVTSTTFNVGYYPGAVRSICYGGGMFVAGNEDGKVAYSSDGINWTQAENGNSVTSSIIDLIVYGNNTFVAWSSSRMAYSTDGINWTVSSGNRVPRSIAYGNGRFVGSTGGTAWISTDDGKNWTQEENTHSPFTQNKGIAFGNGLFVAGYAYTDTAYSRDGINWITISSIYDIGFETFAYGNGKFVGGSSSGKIMYCEW
jgi:hypothetical protein